MGTYVDIHVIQSLPPSCVNRDDNGSPKSALYGGVRRLRVSSQAWKRATRLAFAEVASNERLGRRTKRLVELLERRIVELQPELAEQARGLAEAAFDAAGIKLKVPKGKADDAAKESGYLVFVSDQQLTRLAELACAAEDGKIDKKAAKRAFSEDSSIDIALFGRMLADDASLNVDAACQVAHALSTHAAENEFDYFTAVDDEKHDAEEEDAGAGMIGTVEFSSATLYRYATINVGQLAQNLGTNGAAVDAVEAFASAFVRSMPTGKQNTFANRTLPELVYVTVRSDQPISLVGAFETAVRGTSGYVTASVEKLAQYAAKVADVYGVAPEAQLVAGMAADGMHGLGETVPFPALLAALREAVEQRFPEES
ncbi:type I-E CRISPR-associated protein Cas7/Cse4/CasC [Buchananella hordeovulneris]|uniref:Type I-E CRISPR-associated protein Cas7/Cse4/CasC n=1 Tax=Buchananella hordeovulneris TaxID=52770 RepID=A0A1Q5PUI7_9ACTO|nr:type I-E CRISPR-associated protein Cas7/Cse4/CasC [Buchananella hordeovulneris]MDO5079918.1 type I-E CRISPR-associated protein Cas7/Cse4/CasC [Buchananella hordeovulneris]OKL51149.1 type I-E CRISPR-associated protein Cas7/Cse4/CasC [Buchananella hordeovulneris]RRD51872.1 type I-E CRISPR-associated protein Cas7/Cse4/CasC [Buchananella hordeovulneris]